MKLKPKEFKFKDEYDISDNDELKGRLNYGFIAQEVEEILGDKVAIVKKPNNEDEHYGLDYSQFIAPMVAAIQSQQKKIDELEERLTQLEKLVKV